VRLPVGAVSVQTGNFSYFDSARQCLDVSHIAASGALPPGLAPVEIDGEHYWDGGLISNTPYSTCSTSLLNDTGWRFKLISFRGRERQAGYAYMTRTLRDLRWVVRERGAHGVRIFDLTPDQPVSETTTR
jgi:predicted patatin/cPLA2 family phospholipase